MSVHATITSSIALQPQPTWTPSDPSSTRIEAFRRKIAAKYSGSATVQIDKGHGNGSSSSSSSSSSSADLGDYWKLWKWSVENVGSFWEEVWDECGIVGEMGPEGAAVKSTDKMYPPPLWFPDSSVNFAENILRNCLDPVLKDKEAVISCFEPSLPASMSTGLDSSSDLRSLKYPRFSLTHPELYDQVAQAASAFRSLGIVKGDVISAYSSNNLPSLIALLAAAAIGAVFCSISSDSSPEAVLDRFTTVRPRWIVGVEEVGYNGKRWPQVEKLKEVLRRMEEGRGEDQARVEGVILAPGISGLSDLDWEGSSVENLCQKDERWMSWKTFLGLSKKQIGQGGKIDFERMGFNDPLWILFTSGTTGKPKAIVHRSGGILLQLAKEHLLHSGLDRNDVLFQYSTLSWMMAPWSFASLIAGSTLILYDGSPLSTSPLNLFELARREGITVLGASAAYYEILMKKDVRPREETLKVGEEWKIRQMLSTGSPLRAEVYEWIRERVGEILVGSITGGTDICSLFAGNNVALPVYAGEIQCPMLGMHVGIVASSTSASVTGCSADQPQVHPLPPLVSSSSPSSSSSSSSSTTTNGTKATAGNDGERDNEGELVCLSPFPAQPICFYNEPLDVPDGRYRTSYYQEFGERVWAHGDWCAWTSRGGLLMKGRSDSVLNPGGVRFGSSEIYEVINDLSTSGQEPYSSIQSCIALALTHPKPGGAEMVVLLLQLGPTVKEVQPTRTMLPTTTDAGSDLSKTSDPVNPDSEASTDDKVNLDVDKDVNVESPSDVLSRLIPLLTQALRTRRSARHVPDFILSVSCPPPRTINGKLAEVPAKKVLNGIHLIKGQGKKGKSALKLNTSTLEGGAEGKWIEEYERMGQMLREQLLAADG